MGNLSGPSSPGCTPNFLEPLAPSPNPICHEWRSALGGSSESLPELGPNALHRLSLVTWPTSCSAGLWLKTSVWNQALPKCLQLLPAPTSAPEVLVPFRLFMAICCGNGCIHGPTGSRRRRPRGACGFMRVVAPSSHSDPEEWGRQRSQPSQETMQTAIKHGLLFLEV